jgi:hypothetical protein
MKNKHSSRFLWIAALCGCSLPSVCVAQSARDLRQGNADYPIPDPVALIALQENAPSLLYPSTVRSLVFSFQYTQTANRNLGVAGVEIAPLLMGDAVDLSEYLSGRMMRMLLRTRISMSAELNPKNGFRGALGLRWMSHDDADPRSDSLFQKTLAQWGREMPSLESPCSELADPVSQIACLTKAVSNQQGLQPRIDSLRNAMKDSLWNHSVFEFAVVALHNSVNKETASEDFQQYHAYFSIALPVVGRNGQVVLGFTGRVGHNDESSLYKHSGSVIFRGVYGNPYRRGFIETNFAAANGFQPDVLLGAGYSLQIGNGVWLNSGVTGSLLGRDWNKPELYLRLNFGTPEIRN